MLGVSISPERKAEATLFLGNAVGFQLAATRIAHIGVGADFPWPPFFSCIGHSIELSLKSWMVVKGATDRHLRVKVGHDLDKAVAEAVKTGLRVPSPTVLELVAAIKAPHLKHQFRYLGGCDVKSLPTVEYTLDAIGLHLKQMVEQLPELMPD